MQTFPLTLRDIGGAARLVHLYAEHRGSRYYLASDQTFHGAELVAVAWRREYPTVAMYLSDRNDSTIIHGGPAEFAAVAPRA